MQPGLQGGGGGGGPFGGHQTLGGLEKRGRPSICARVRVEEQSGSVAFALITVNYSQNYTPYPYFSLNPPTTNPPPPPPTTFTTPGVSNFWPVKFKPMCVLIAFSVDNLAADTELTHQVGIEVSDGKDDFFTEERSIHDTGYFLSHDWQNSRLLIGQLLYDMKLY